jgi:hypothetical protein
MMTHPDESNDSSGADDGSSDLSVALDTLTADDGTNPAVGDDVDVEVKGKVSRIDEATNCAYVTPDTLNGQPSPDMGPDNPHDALQQNAQTADSSQSYA